MSPSIWTRCAGSSEIRRLATSPWRVVEAQHQVSTRKLVDSDDEQALLEEILERHKPPALGEGARFHYLLTTPFRYPPLAHGSRFATRRERGLWYGAESLRTAFAEVAYYRLLFLEGTAADLGSIATDLSAFTVPLKTKRGLDLTRTPFDRWRDEIASKTSYEASQALGGAMREAGVEAFRFRSARDVRGGVNVGVFALDAFAASRPRRIDTWRCSARRGGVEIAKRDYFETVRHAFARREFLVRGRLPRPGIDSAIPSNPPSRSFRGFP